MPSKDVVPRTKAVFGGSLSPLAEPKESQIDEGHLRPDHVHLMMAIPPKYAVSQVIGYIKGKSAIPLARVYGERKGNFVGQHIWARGFYESTVGRDEAVIRESLQKQEQEDKRLGCDYFSTTLQLRAGWSRSRSFWMWKGQY